MANKARVKWVEGRRFLGESGSGHAVVMEGAPNEGEVAVGIRPMEMLLLGMGGCTMYDMVSILEKAREKITAVVVELEGERAEEFPQVYTHIHVHYIITGNGVKQAAVERAVNLSTQKYCSATIMLGATAEISHDYEIVEADEQN